MRDINKYFFEWRPKSFQSITKLPTNFFDYISIEAHSETASPLKTKVEQEKQENEISSWLSKETLTLKTKGGYRKHTKHLIEQFRPQKAKIFFTKIDAESRIMNKTEPKEITDDIYTKIRKKMEGKIEEDHSCFFLMLNQILIEKEKGYELTDYIHKIKYFEKISGISVFNTPNEEGTKVKYLIKKYDFFHKIKNNQLNDLQDFLECILKTNIRETPSIQQTKINIETEFNQIKYANTHRSPIDYNQAQKEIHWLAKTLNIHTTNEKNLLELIKQQYKNHPDYLIEKYQEFYNTKKPEITISAEATCDNLKITKLRSKTHPKKSLEEAIVGFIDWIDYFQ